MGYTHYWYRPAEIPASAFRAAVSDFKRIMPAMAAAGVLLADGLGEGLPVLTDDEISLNGPEHCGHPKNHEVVIPWPTRSAGGIGTPAEALNGSWFAGATLEARCCDGSCAYETFHIARVIDPKEQTRYQGGLYWDFCKTGFRPYDVAVTAFLVILQHHCPQVVVRSDGEDPQWFDGKLLCQMELGYGLDFKITESRIPEEEEPQAEVVKRLTSQGYPPIIDLSRAAVIKRIKQALKQRSGRQWSVTGGKGTAYGWIRIKAVKPYAMDEWGTMNEADRKLLGKLLGLDQPAHFQGESIPASSAYYIEYIDRAEGRKPRKCGSPYWD